MSDKIKKFLLPLLLFSLSFVGAFAQIKMPSPEVQSMLKFGKNDVSQYSGGVDIGIDIFNIDSFVKLPIRINYTGSHGILVRENASRVGLGWSLSPSLVVTKIVKGMPDASQHGFSKHHSYYDFDSPFDEFKFGFEYEPDLHYYSTLKNSGSFYYSKNNEILKIPLSNTSINSFFDSNQSFIITETDGVQYIYDNVEISGSRMVSPVLVSNNWDLTSSRHISKIVSYNKKDTIYFNYILGREISYNYDNNGEPSFIDANKTILGYPKSYTINQTKVLSEIKWKFGVVKFIYNEGRKDIEGGRLLNEIVVLDKSGNTIKLCKFKYSYFTPSGVVSYENGENYSYENESQGSALRLKLVGITIYGSSNRNGQQYSFEYEDNVFLPRRDSYSIDHWGYYNGASNETLNPLFKLEPNGQISSIDGANRQANEFFMKAGVLKKIVFPTGGYSLFNFEANTIHNTKLRSTKYVGNRVSQRIASTMQMTPPGGDDRELIDGNFDPTSTRTVRLDLSNLKLTGNTGILKIYTKNFPVGLADPILINFGSETLSLPATSSSNAYFYSIPKGVYEVSIKSNARNVGEWDVFFVWNDEYPDYDSFGNIKVGGLRISKILNFIDGNVVSEKRYEYNESSGRSSGALVQEPEYIYMFNNAYILNPTDKPHTDIVPNQDPSLYPHLFFSNNPIYPLRLTQSSVVGYGKVTELVRGSGKTESFFITPSELPDYSNSVLRTPPYRLFERLSSYGNIPYFPIAEKQSNDFARGKIVKQFIYNENANSYTLVKELEYKYKGYCISPIPKFSQYNVNYGLKILGDNLNDYIVDNYSNDNLNRSNYNIDFIQNSSVVFPDMIKSIKGQMLCNKNGSAVQGCDYFITSGIVLVDSLVERSIYNNSFSTSISKYSYNSLGQIVLNESNLGSKVKSFEYSYPSKSFLQDLFYSNCIDIPYLEIVKNNGKFCSAILREYSNFNKFNNLLLYKIKEGYSLNSNNVINYREKEVCDFYDIQGRLTQSKSIDGVIKAYVWDDISEYPIAVVNNASIKDVFFSSFEDSRYDVDSLICHTGLKCKVNGFIKYLTNLSTGQYLLSFWEYSNNKWNLRESKHFVDNSFVINITGKVDDVCFRPIQSTIITHTFKPLVGTSSITDEKYQTTYYNYDSFGRLENVLDAYGKLKARYEYNLKNDLFYLDFSKDILNYSELGGVEQVDVTSNVPWSVTVSDNWISCRSINKNGKASLSIECNSNSGKSRSGLVTLNSSSYYGNLVKKIYISQNSGEPTLSVSSSSLSFGWLQESQAVAVSSSASWSVTSKSGTFITVSQPDSGTLSITCSKNMGASERTGQVVLSNGTSTVTVTVSQGVDPSIYSQI